MVAAGQAQSLTIFYCLKFETPPSRLMIEVEGEVDFATDGQSASTSWCWAPFHSFIQSYIIYPIDPFWLNDATGCRTYQST
jgi:hypothetical protein